MTDRSQLLQVLSQIQNDPSHQHHDIMTFSGFLTEPGELERHIERNFEQTLRHMREFKVTKNGRYIRRKRLPN